MVGRMSLAGIGVGERGWGGPRTVCRLVQEARRLALGPASERTGYAICQSEPGPWLAEGEERASP